jgi:hypothetical protein
MAARVKRAKFGEKETAFPEGKRGGVWFLDREIPGLLCEILDIWM